MIPSDEIRLVEFLETSDVIPEPPESTDKVVNLTFAVFVDVERVRLFDVISEDSDPTCCARTPDS
ncbi:hypothetical protein [Aeromicrobium duanguangcaii]|uniref:hypothetical protein n=1 Tax=Aeromicrobium duanguangcaii TaxID=2968086 RepID=UPI00201738AA|nr:hypothetical protein [Aeromicrobium duanguangcaii]MCL3838367.1 hypothetical protein [Aeromicrobium duanguangcaii]